jgi:ornithine cyclodeaminase/alanine dehydrogenase-like protein (mu-crystallin family)
MRIVRNITDVRVWSPRNARAFADEHDVTLAASAADAVKDADIVVVATGAQEPVLFGRWLSAGTHVNAVGANRPTWRELDDELLNSSRVYVESRESAAVESGDLIAAGEIFAEIGEVLLGIKPARESDDEITLFKSLGSAVEDIAAADLVYQNATNAEVFSIKK